MATERATGRARALLRTRDADTIREQLRIVAIPAPSGEEQARGRYVHERFLECGLADVHTDAVGNVLGRLPGGTVERSRREAVILAAHLDTVFPAGTEVTPRKANRRVYAPGITDNARGLAALLALAKVLMACEVATRLPVWLVATVGEEGAGDLRGVKHLFRADSAFRRAAAFIALDGSGLRRVVHRSIGSRRLRAKVRGPGGHSWSDYGLANPIHALGAAIDRLRALELPSSPLVTLAVTRIGGGTSVNSIPTEAWIEIDMRSEDREVLHRVEVAARAALKKGLTDEDPPGDRPRGRLSLQVEVIGDRPCGLLHAEHPFLQAAMQATRLAGAEPELAGSSTDANVPMSLGIPSIAIGAGGEAGGVHTPGEWYDNREGTRGLERALLLLLASAGIR